MSYIKNQVIAMSAGLLLVGAPSALFAYDDGYERVYVESRHYNQDLDLNAVASLFGKSRDLAEFEWKLNDPWLQISNLDLNDDGEVDYLRVIETSQRDVRLIVIQAIIGPDRYQDVASIEVFREGSDYTRVQIVGDPYIYGYDYIIQPYYGYSPVIFNYFWDRPRYTPYYSRYRWNYYPSRYRPWRPQPVPYYNRQIHRHIDSRNEYRRARSQFTPEARQMHRSISKRDFANQHPLHPPRENLYPRGRINRDSRTTIQRENSNNYDRRHIEHERNRVYQNRNIPSQIERQNRSYIHPNNERSERIQQLKESNRLHYNNPNQNINEYNQIKTNPTMQLHQRDFYQNRAIQQQQNRQQSEQKSHSREAFQERMRQYSEEHKK